MNLQDSRVWLFGVAVGVAVLGGCDTPDAPAFRLNMVQMVSDETPTPQEYQKQIANVMAGLFGTPDAPYAPEGSGLDQRKLEMAAGPAWTDQQGANFGLYRRHCVHCHGVNGDGRGPTALFLNPYPRDYRNGIYKFKSTYNPARPTDQDLTRVLTNGVPGTAMPSFSLLPQAEIESLVEYVKYLSMRGQVETELARFVFNDLGEEEVENDEGETVTQLVPFNPAEDAEQMEVLNDIISEVADDWASANEQVIIPEEDMIPADNRTDEEVAASVAKGRELFYGTTANCVKCHGPTGLGDGQQDDYDVWNKAHKLFLDSLAVESGDDEDSLADLRQDVAASLYPIRHAIPRDLRHGIYRGGNRRIDIFCRVYAGIAGTPMPGSGPASPGASSTLTDEEIWSIVDYVLSLPYEAPSRPQEALPTNVETLN